MAGGRSLSTENDFLRGLALAPGLQTHGQRVAHRNSTHSFALDKTFRFIDGMTKERATVRLRSSAGPEESRVWEKRSRSASNLLRNHHVLLCHPERSRGICSSPDLSWECEVPGHPLTGMPTYWTTKVMLIMCCGPAALLEAVTETV
jgi:hypothetical protein